MICRLTGMESNQTPNVPPSDETIAESYRREVANAAECIEVLGTNVVANLAFGGLDASDRADMLALLRKCRAAQAFVKSLTFVESLQADSERAFEIGTRVTLPWGHDSTVAGEIVAGPKEYDGNLCFTVKPDGLAGRVLVPVERLAFEDDCPCPGCRRRRGE